MKVTGLAIVPPPTAADAPQVTPELLASVLARYSRSNEGLARILEKVDVAHPDESIDRILRFVDYGHASIGGLTGGLAVAVDDVSMWLAYKLFEISPMADGQESSTRYIAMDPTHLPSAGELGIPDDLVPRWRELLARAFAAYHAEYARLEALSRTRGSSRLQRESQRPRVLGLLSMATQLLSMKATVPVSLVTSTRRCRRRASPPVTPPGPGRECRPERRGTSCGRVIVPCQPAESTGSRRLEGSRSNVCRGGGDSYMVPGIMLRPPVRQAPFTSVMTNFGPKQPTRMPGWRLCRGRKRTTPRPR